MIPKNCPGNEGSKLPLVESTQLQDILQSPYRLGIHKTTAAIIEKKLHKRLTTTYINSSHVIRQIRHISDSTVYEFSQKKTNRSQPASLNKVRSLPIGISYLLIKV